MVDTHNQRWVPINYREFWDVPRIFFVEDDGQLYLFDCRFDEAIEDYPDEYRVYLMPHLGAEELAGSWAKVDRKAIRQLGTVPVARVKFDPTKREQIDAAILDEFAAATRSLG